LDGAPVAHILFGMLNFSSGAGRPFVKLRPCGPGRKSASATKSRSTGPDQAARPRRAKPPIIAVGAMLGVLVAAGAQGQTATQPQPPAPIPQLGPMTQDQLEMAARFEVCRQKLKEARKDGLVTALRFGATAMEIEVDGTTWKPMPFDTKLALVQTVSCYGVAGNTRIQARVQVLDGRDHHKLGDYDGSTLKIP
jgi:hypothetical protein